MALREEQRARAVGLFVHSMIATKPFTAEEAEGCNARAVRAKNFLLHATARPVVTVAGPMTSVQMDTARLEALRSLRTVCATCGLCRRFGLQPP